VPPRAPRAVCRAGAPRRAQFQFKVGPGNFCCVHVSLVPVLGVVGEQKTKPTQHSVATLRSLGLSPHLLACRSQEPLSDAVREKLVRAPSRAPAAGPRAAREASAVHDGRRPRRRCSARCPQTTC